jgi:phospholipase C
MNMTPLPRLLLWTLCASLLTSACLPARTAAPTPLQSLPTPSPAPIPTPTKIPTPILPTPTALPLVPNFSRIGIVIFENREFGFVIDNPDMPYFNILADSYTLLTQHYAVTHPSLPNYIALIGGDTFGINSNCETCFINAPSLPDLIEEGGRTWKTYQDDMPEPCFLGNTLRYYQKHNPFIYFDPIRLDAERCARTIVPLTQMDEDIAANALPNFFFITPDICYSAHDCGLELADDWLKELMNRIVPALDASGEPYLIVITWDEGQGNHSCCGLPESAGGRIATILVSPQAKSGFRDDTPYSHYSLLKTISEAWGLPYLGHAADGETNLITAPWK